MARKLFIVDRGNERLFAALRSTVANEPDVEILYDRRDASRAAACCGRDRRVPSDVGARIRRDGFAVVRPAPPAKPEGNIRWA